MNPPHGDMITWGKMLRKVPAIVRALPRVVRGLRAANVTDPGQPCGLGWHFEQATLRNPHGHAVLYGDRVLSYADVNRQANRIAHYLQAQGVGKGDVVALFIENRPELLLCVLAVAKLGGVCAMVNTAQTQATLVHSLNLVSPVAIVVGGELMGAYDAVRDQVSIQAARTWFIPDQPAPEPEGYIELIAASADCPEGNPASTAQVFFNDPCFYIYTSGTTGLPKAGIMKHGRWTRTAVSFGRIALDMGPDDVLYCTLPLYHATGLCVLGLGDCRRVGVRYPPQVQRQPVLGRCAHVQRDHPGLCGGVVPLPARPAAERKRSSPPCHQNGRQWPAPRCMGPVQGAIWRGACLRVIRCQ